MNTAAAAPMPGTAAPAQTEKGKVLGYAHGKITNIAPSENGDGVNVLVEFPAPIGQQNVYVKAGRTLPEIGATAKFMAIIDPGELTPRIRLAGQLSEAAVLEVFTLKA